MCGILGYSLRQPGAVSEISRARALKLLSHRGPDAIGRWEDPGGTWFGHCRLKVVDLNDRSNQPFSDPDGRVQLVYNGEIYNWRELRNDLQQQGYTFHTTSDTEVLLAAYRAHGFSCLEKLRGMYAFALFDADSQQIFCARDPIGEKPFFYSESCNGVFFSSELSALLALLPEPPELDLSAVASVLLHNLRHVPDPQTGFTNISSLRPGYACVIEKGAVVSMWRHWQPDTRRRVQPHELKQIILSAVKERMQADVPVGLLLSGGFDSTCIASIIAAEASEPLRTYTLGRDEADEDIRRARLVAREIGSIHTELFFDADRVWSDFQTVIEQYGSPIALLPLLYTMQLCEAMKDHGTSVALTGHGADELFLGYTGQWRRAQLSKLLQWVPGASSVCKLAPGAIQALAAPARQRRAALYHIVADSVLPAFLRPDYLPELRLQLPGELELLGALVPSPFYSDEATLTSLLLENQHSLSLAADFPAMQHGVELRCPFMDAQVVAATLQVPFAERAALFPPGEKVFLRRLMKSYVPDHLANLPKRGFGFSIQEADLFSGSWRQHCEEYLLATPPPFFRTDALAGCWRQFLAGDARQAGIISRLLAISVWYRKFFN